MNPFDLETTRLRDVTQLLSGTSIASQSAGASDESKEIDKLLRGIRERTTRPHPQVSREASLEERLYDALASFKVHTASVAMHLERDWRQSLFKQLDGLLELENWEDSDLPPTLSSFATLLRMIFVLNPARRPGLSATSDGYLIASWTVDDYRLSIECQPNDRVRWLVSRPLDGEVEYGAGLSDTQRLPIVLAPYDPTKWFGSVGHVH